MTIPLAHSAGSGGSLDQIALAAGVLLLGLAFLVQKSMDRKVSIALVVLGLAGLIASFTVLKNIGGANTIVVNDQEYTEEELQDAITGLCTARETADRDVDEAEDIFQNRAHLPLHVIAAGVEDEDRAVTAELLEAKTALEDEFINKRRPEEVVSRMTDLIEITAEALDTLGVPASTC